MRAACAAAVYQHGRGGRCRVPGVRRRRSSRSRDGCSCSMNETRPPLRQQARRGAAGSRLSWGVVFLVSTIRSVVLGLVLAAGAASATPAHGQVPLPVTPVAGPLEVAAFANLSGDPADAWIGDGIAATLAADLGRTAGAAPRGLRVNGAYQRSGDLLRITARLVDAASGLVVAATRVDGAVSDLFGLQDELAARLAEAARRAKASASCSGFSMKRLEIGP